MVKVRDNDVLFVKSLMNNIAVKTNVAQLCRVTRIVTDDGSKIDAQPLPLNRNGDKRALLVNVHVGRLLRSELKVGDVVVVIFIDRSLENWDGTNRDFVLTSGRMHDVNDAFVIEVY